MEVFTLLKLSDKSPLPLREQIVRRIREMILSWFAPHILHTSRVSILLV